MQHNGFKCLCVIYSWLVYIKHMSDGPARLLHACDLFIFIVCACGFGFLWTMTNLLSHRLFLSISLGSLWNFSSWKQSGSIYSQTALYAGEYQSGRLQRPVSGTAQYLAYVCGEASVVSSKRVGWVIVSPRVGYFQVTFTDARLCKP